MQQRDRPVGQQYQPDPAESRGGARGRGIRAGRRLRAVRGRRAASVLQLAPASDDEPPPAGGLAGAGGRGRPSVDAAASGDRHIRRGRVGAAPAAVPEPRGGRRRVRVRCRHLRARASRRRRHRARIPAR